MAGPDACVRAITVGLVLGSSKKATKALGAPETMSVMTEWREGDSTRDSFQLARTLAWVAAMARQPPASMWRVSPGNRPHLGNLQAPDSLGAQFRRSQSVRYRPLRSLAWMVAALTAVEEEPQVVHIGWTDLGG